MRRTIAFATLWTIFGFLALAGAAFADVGYTPPQGSRSLAGSGHGKSPATLNLRVDPWCSIDLPAPDGSWICPADKRLQSVDRSKMAGRYGRWWDLGTLGRHAPDWEQTLETECANRTASWINDPAAYGRLDCIATEREWNDAYYTQGSNVRISGTPGSSGGTGTGTCPPCPTCPTCPTCPVCTACPPAPDAGAYTKDRLPAEGAAIEFFDRFLKASHRGQRWGGRYYTAGGSFDAAEIYYWRPVLPPPEVK